MANKPEKKPQTNKPAAATDTPPSTENEQSQTGQAGQSQTGNFQAPSLPSGGPNTAASGAPANAEAGSNAGDGTFDPGPLPDADAEPLPESAYTDTVELARHRLIFELEQAAAKGHGLAQDKERQGEAAALIRHLLDLEGEKLIYPADPHPLGAVKNDPPMGHSLKGFERDDT